MEIHMYKVGEDEMGREIHETYYVYKSPVYVHFGEGASCKGSFFYAKNTKEEVHRIHRNSAPVYQDEYGQYWHECRFCHSWHASDCLPEGAFSVILRDVDEWFNRDGIPF